MKQNHSWEITDAFWKAAEPLVPHKTRDPRRDYQRKPGGGRPPMEPRKVLEAIFYVLRTGVQWNALPESPGSSSAVHRYFRFWCEAGFFQALWRAGLGAYEEVRGIQWSWLSADGCMSKAPLAQEAAGGNPTDRGKKREQTPYAHRHCRSTAVAGCHRGEPTRCVAT
jgi:transposase